MKVGDCVKMCLNDVERFWARVQRTDGNAVFATVDNDLLSVEWSKGQLLTFERRHIYEVFASPNLNGRLREINHCD